MKKIISFVGLFAVLGVGIGDAHGVAMSAQVRRLLQEKQEKIEQLEKCEGKKQGWMIAGISTIGLTAVGVGVNIAQASKSNRLSDEIEMEKSTLERHQNELNRIQNDIAAERAKQAKDEQQTQKGSDDLPKYVPAGGGKYDDYKLTCDMVRFTFDKVDDYSAVLASLNVECQRVMKRNMVNLTELGLGGSDASKVVFECSGYKESLICESNGGVIGQPCTEGIENIANSKFTGVWTRDDKGQYTCNATANDNFPIPCACKKMEGGNGVEPVTPAKLDQNCRTSYDKKPTTDCPCDGDKGLLDFGHGKCECKTGEEWNDKKCVGKKDEKKDDKKPAGQCIKTYEEYLGVGCVCDSGKGLIPVLDDMSGKRYCGCGMSSTWNGQKCVEKKGEKKDDKKPAGQCIKTHEEYLDVGCVCESGKGLIPVLDDMSGKKYCGCSSNKVWDAQRKECVSSGEVACSDGYVRIDGKGECVKRDYLFTDSCKCAKDSSRMCKLDTDHGGDLVCQLAKGIGKKCKCEDCPNGEIIDTNTGKCVEPGKQNVGWLGPNGGLGFDPKP